MNDGLGKWIGWIGIIIGILGFFWLHIILGVIAIIIGILGLFTEERTLNTITIVIGVIAIIIGIF